MPPDHLLSLNFLENCRGRFVENVERIDKLKRYSIEFYLAFDKQPTRRRSLQQNENRFAVSFLVPYFTTLTA